MPVYSWETGKVMSRNLPPLAASISIWLRAIAGVVIVGALATWLAFTLTPRNHSDADSYQAQQPISEPELSPVSSSQATAASKLVSALSKGGDATAMQFVSPTAHFHYAGVMFGMKGCRLTSQWYSPGTGTTLSGEMTCPDRDMIAVDITFDSNGRVTKLLGQGAYREFDSTVTTNRTY